MPLKTGQKANFAYEQKLKIAEEYNSGKCNSISLGRKYNLTQRTICKYIKECGVEIRNNSKCQQKYKLNEDYFEKIDTEEKAYILGLLYADGCLSKDGRIILSLEEKDLEIIEKVKSNLEFSGPIAYIKPKSRKWNKTLGYMIGASGQYRLSIRNKKLTQDLIKLGCVSAKSLILEFPTKKQVPEHLVRHFIRGYFDGDGSLSEKKSKNKLLIQSSITSTFNFLSKIKEILSYNTINSGIYHPKKLRENGNKVTSILSTTSSSNSLLFLEWIYKDCSIFMQRKYNKFIKIKDKVCTEIEL